MGGREWWHLSVGTRKRDRRGRQSVRVASKPNGREASFRAPPTVPPSAPSPQVLQEPPP